jgi:phosphate transport system protein
VRTPASGQPEEVTALKTRLFEMGAAAEEMLADALRALRLQDYALAQGADERDTAIDAMDTAIESLCQQLMARPGLREDELRLISTALKVVTDIERIADHAVDISRLVERIGREAFYQPLVDIPRLGEAVCQMLRDALEAFLHQDNTLASAAIAQDDVVDALYSRMRGELSALMQKEPKSVIVASHLLFVTHYLERIADHATNIAERVHYLQATHP